MVRKSVVTSEKTGRGGQKISRGMVKKLFVAGLKKNSHVGQKFSRGLVGK